MEYIDEQLSTTTRKKLNRTGKIWKIETVLLFFEEQSWDFEQRWHFEKCFIILNPYLFHYFSYLTIQKLNVFGMYAWDFGIYHQAIFTTAKLGNLFYTTVELPYTQTAYPVGTQFAVHFSPILFLIVPFYAIFSSPVTLLIIKTAIISIGAIPVFLLAKKEHGDKIGLIFASGYLLLPAIHGITWYDFQPQSFLPTFLLFTFLS